MITKYADYFLSGLPFYPNKKLVVFFIIGTMLFNCFLYSLPIVCKYNVKYLLISTAKFAIYMCVSGKSNKIILAVTEDIEKYISLALSDKNLFEEEDFRRDRKRSQKENEENENSSECIEVILTQTKCKTFYSSDLNRLLSPRVMKRLYAFYNSYKIPDDSHPASLLFFIVFIVCVRNRKEFAEAVKFISYNSKNFGVV